MGSSLSISRLFVHPAAEYKPNPTIEMLSNFLLYLIVSLQRQLTRKFLCFPIGYNAYHGLLEETSIFIAYYMSVIIKEVSHLFVRVCVHSCKRFTGCAIPVDLQGLQLCRLEHKCLLGGTDDKTGCGVIQVCHI